MTTQGIEILLVEDNPDDLDMALCALRNAKLANHIHVARDGVEALEFIFGEGAPRRTPKSDGGPKVILLDLKLPKVDGLEVSAAGKERSAHQNDPGGGAYVLEGATRRGGMLPARGQQLHCQTGEF